MSHERPDSDRPAHAGSAGRVRLADLMMWVLAAAITAAVFRNARPARWFGPVIDVPRILGLAATVLAILTVMGLFCQVLARWRNRQGGPWAGAIVWRLAVLALLGTALVAEADLVGGDVVGDVWSDPVAVRLRLLPLALTFALAGILAALTPSGSRARQPIPRMVWLSVIWATAAGVVIAATQAFIPYLVLLALDAVRNAMHPPGVLVPSEPKLHGRLLRAGLAAAPVVAACAGLGLLIATDFRQRATGGDRPNWSWRWTLALLTTAAGAAGGAAWLLAFTIPALDPWLAEGLRAVVDPLNAGIILLGFAGLALGPAARAMARTESAQAEPSRGPRFGRLLHVLANLILAVIVLDFIAARAIDLVVARRLADSGSVDPSWMGWVGWVDAVFDWLRSVVPLQRFQPWSIFETPEWVALGLAEVWVAWRVAALLLKRNADRVTPIEESLSERRALGRFALRWAALTVLMTAALPASLVAGLALVHVLIRVSV